MKFFSNVLSTVVGLFVFVMFFFFGIVFLGMIFGSSSEIPKVESNSVIELNLDKISDDYAGQFTDPWVTTFSGSDKIGLVDVLNAIKSAEDDDNIKGIIINNASSSLGMAQSKSLRDALEHFKKSGKFIYAYADMYSQKEYYIGSVANKIFLNPIGELEFKGLSTEVMFYKDFQEKTGLKMEVIRHGKFKSAVEPYLENQMSEANLEQTNTLLKSVWSNIVSDISSSRKISVEALNQIANNLGARTAKLALENKMIDVVAYEDQFHDFIKKSLDVKYDEDYNSIDIFDYTNNYLTYSAGEVSGDKIAIIYAQGEISSGEGDVNVIAEGAMRRSIEEAREDKNVKAIVLRVDSPGGSALTSELIWREIELTTKVKPVVTSMGNYAASGGYYISCNSNMIFAEKNTITGSIGVFGMLPNVSKAINNYGIRTQTVTTHENSASYSLFSPLTENMRSFTQEGVEDIYKVFISRVAKGRKMTVEQVDNIGQGRVWAGTDALKIGLVDKIGGLNDAIEAAAKLSKTKDYSTVNYPVFDKKLNELFNKFPFAKAKEDIIKEEIGEQNYELLQKTKRVQNRKGIQAIMPFEINIQ